MIIIPHEDMQATSCQIIELSYEKAGGKVIVSVTSFADCLLAGGHRRPQEGQTNVPARQQSPGPVLFKPDDSVTLSCETEPDHNEQMHQMTV